MKQKQTGKDAEQTATYPGGHAKRHLILQHRTLRLNPTALEVYFHLTFYNPANLNLQVIRLDSRRAEYRHSWPGCPVSRFSLTTGADILRAVEVEIA
ncbi:MAG: hypothetical protein OXG98_00140 [Gemmatimonadetes bacterium]|nr:hypothetical protein [Gemmatimonadota bacterium]